jgi:hypothetical protein
VILDRLSELFGAPPVSEDQPPKSIFKNLAFLHGETGSGARGAAAPRKPEVRIQKAAVVDGRWDVMFEVRAKNREEGWCIAPRLAFVGLDGSHVDVDWDSFEVGDPATNAARGTLILKGTPRGRILTTTIRATSVRDLPIPASESAIDVRIASADVAPPDSAGEASA